MRFVVDTNISAFFWGGVPGKVLEVARRADFTLVSSEALLAELLTVLQREKFSERLRRINRTPAQFLKNYRALIEVIDAVPLLQPVCDDPDDDLLRLNSYAGIPIIKPAQFLSQINNTE